jgi:hypothetical protein
MTIVDVREFGRSLRGSSYKVRLASEGTESFIQANIPFD